MPLPHHVIVDGYHATDDCDLHLERDFWALALDQRAFGPRRLLVAFGDTSGRLLGLAHTAREDPPELSLGFCFEYFRRVADAEQAVVYCDEPITPGPLSALLRARWEDACAIATVHGIRLVDWVACDDHTFRSTRDAVTT